MHRKKRSFCNRCCETTSVRQMSLQPTTPEEQRTFVIILMTASFTFNQPLCIGCWRRVWWWQLFALFWWQPSRPKNGILLACRMPFLCEYRMTSMTHQITTETSSESGFSSFVLSTCVHTNILQLEHGAQPGPLLSLLILGSREYGRY